VQLVDDSTSINGARINLLYGVNENLSGVDFRLVNVLNGDLDGTQGGFINKVEGRTTQGDFMKKTLHLTQTIGNCYPTQPSAVLSQSLLSQFYPASKS
jgi:hypothetical protein